MEEEVITLSHFSVSPSPFGLDFGTLDFGLELENSRIFPLNC